MTCQPANSPPQRLVRQVERASFAAEPRRRTRIAVLAAITIALAGAGVSKRSALGASVALLGHVQWILVAAAVMLELASLAAMAVAAAALPKTAVIRDEHGEPGILETLREQVGARLLGDSEPASHDRAGTVSPRIVPGRAALAAAGEPDFLPVHNHPALDCTADRAFAAGRHPAG
jgi:hypothetical protein